MWGLFQVPPTQSRCSEPAECSESSTYCTLNRTAELMANSSFLRLDFWWRIAQFWRFSQATKMFYTRINFDFRRVVLDWRSPGTSMHFCSSTNKKNPRVVNNSWKSFLPYSSVRKIPASPWIQALWKASLCAEDGCTWFHPGSPPEICFRS